MFINGLNPYLSLPVKWTRMEWEIVSTPYLVNLANQLSHTVHESPKRKTAKILQLQFQQMKTYKWNQKPVSFCCYCKETEHWKRDCYKFKCFKYLQPSQKPFKCPQILSDGALRNYRGSSQFFLLISLEKHFSRLEMNLFLSELTLEPHTHFSTPLL